MRRRQHDVEESGRIGAQVQSAVRVDIRFDSLEQSKPLTDRIVHPVDGARGPFIPAKLLRRRLRNGDRDGCFQRENGGCVRL